MDALRAHQLTQEEAGALDHLERAWEAPETLPATMENLTMGLVTGDAVRGIQHAYAAVRLVGSKVARSGAEVAWSAAWDLSNQFNTPGGGILKMGQKFEAFKAAAREFTARAEAECAL